MKKQREEKRENIEDAAYIWWSRNTIPYLHCLQDMEYQLQDENTPETILIEKDNIQGLSKECRLMAKAILNLPEEMFMINGKLKKTALRKIIHKETGWSIAKIERVKISLADCLLELDQGYSL